MDFSFVFFMNSILLGVGLAMDAFSVSLANGLREVHMRVPKMCAVAGIFSVFQGLMPLIGWVCVHTVAQYFTAFEKCIPYIALVLLLAIGGKMVLDSRKDEQQSESGGVGLWALLAQGVATSIDALSVGFTIASYNVWNALIAALLIAGVTFIICLVGIILGKKFGVKLAGKATLFGGILLMAIGVEIFISGIFG